MLLFYYYRHQFWMISDLYFCVEIFYLSNQYLQRYQFLPMKMPCFLIFFQGNEQNSIEKPFEQNSLLIFPNILIFYPCCHLVIPLNHPISNLTSNKIQINKKIPIKISFLIYFSLNIAQTGKDQYFLFFSHNVIQELQYFIIMNRNIENKYKIRNQNLSNFSVHNSLIVTTEMKYPIIEPQLKNKFEEMNYKGTLIKRHDSQKEFKKYENHKVIPTYSGSQVAGQKELEEKEQEKKLNKVKSSEIFSKRSSNTNTNSNFHARNSDGKKNNLKDTYSTTNTENPSKFKTEISVPSFIKNVHKKQMAPQVNNPGVLSKNNFKIIKMLGEGKFGSVYLAQQIWTGLIVGLKLIDKAKIIKDKFMTQFIRQLKIQSFLDHPNIIKVYGSFDDQKYIYIIMELGCDGQLFDIISGGQTLSEETVSFIIGHLLEAINVMHKIKILHRDIKPQNIVLVHGNIKLCDFGWAVNKKEELRSTFCGTPLYLSPEMLQGSRYDEKVDLWAIGVLTYELFYGNSPFDINEQQDLIKIVTQQLNFPLNKPISNEFKQFLTAILIKNPKQRLEGKELVKLEFIKKYSQFQTCQQLCN